MYSYNNIGVPGLLIARIMSARRPLPLRLAAYDKVIMWALSNMKIKAIEIRW
jgi:hypothetical protein